MWHEVLRLMVSIIVNVVSLCVDNNPQNMLTLVNIMVVALWYFRMSCDIVVSL